MIFLIYTILVILQQYSDVSTIVPDPCRSNIQQRTPVVDMCMTNSATEEKLSGSDHVDSVVLRIMIQQDNCICRVNIENQIELVYIGLGKYGGFTSSAPVESECGLAVDINHILDMSTGNVIAPIECIDNVGMRGIPLFINSTLQLKSRIINGSFTRGYCMAIARDSSTDPTQVLRIDCDAPVTIEHTIDQTTEQTTTSDPMTTEQTTHQTTTYDPMTTEQTTHQTTTYDPMTTEQTTRQTIQFDPTPDTSENDKTAYIVVSVCSSTVVIILLVVLVVTCIRYKAMQRTVNRTNQNVNNTNQVERNRYYCDLTNNLPSVLGQEYDIINSNYNTIDVNIAQPSSNVVCMEGEYINVEPDGQITTNMK